MKLEELQLIIEENLLTKKGDKLKSNLISNFYHDDEFTKWIFEYSKQLDEIYLTSSISFANRIKYVYGLKLYIRYLLKKHKNIIEFIEDICFDVDNCFKPSIVKNNGEYIKNKYPERLREIFEKTKFLDSIDPYLQQRLFHLYYNINYIVKCKECGKIVKFKKFSKGYNNFCSIKCSSNNEKTREKYKNTSIEKYGQDNPFKSVVVRNVYKSTCLERYGVDHYSKTDEYKKKFKETCLLRYDEVHPFKLSIFLKKCEQTWLNNWGVKHPAQSSQYQDKVQNGYRNSWHDYQLPSGNWIKLQGYEPKALDVLLKFLPETDIILRKLYMPVIWYYGKDNKWHRYYPDIFIPKMNLIIEVKSEYTFNKYKEINLLKEKSTKNLGFNYEFWIFNQ